jgi:hypothetical protein
MHFVPHVIFYTGALLAGLVLFCVAEGKNEIDTNG